MAQNYYDVAILGATFLGLGAALKMKRAIVIEKGNFFGAEFINSYKVCKSKLIHSKTELGDHFVRNLRSRKLISENGDIYQAPAMYVLSEYLKEKSIEILLVTETIEVKRENGDYYITVYHAKGFETIVAKTLLDTTLDGIGVREKEGRKLCKTLNSIMFNPKKNMIDNLSYNMASGLYTYVLPISLEKTKFEAMEDFFAMGNMLYANDMKISSIAPEFSYHLDPFEREVENGHIWNPSVAYTNLVEAFDMGVLMAERIEYESI